MMSTPKPPFTTRPNQARRGFPGGIRVQMSRFNNTRRPVDSVGPVQEQERQ